MSPAVRVQPSLERRLALLGQAARFDLSCSCGPAPGRVPGPDDRFIYPAALPSGRRVPVLKVLQEGGCERGCTYCAQRHGGVGGGAASFAPEELARLFVDLRQAGRVQGLFLSSAIRGGPVASMDRMLATALILRQRYGYHGYLHLKIIPGCRPDQVEQAMALATRVSVNLEAPTPSHLARLAPAKKLEAHILAPMRQVAHAEAAGRFHGAGQTTQLVVGAADENDREIGRAAARLYRDLHLARVYYSAFQPIPGTPLEDRPPTLPLREHRLYQMDFLLRRYGFDFDEIPFDEAGRLSLAADPKREWAARHPERFPVELNTAPVEELVRVPGIGPTSARRIVRMRRERRLRSLAALGAAGAAWRTAGPYVLLDGRAPACQLSLGL